MPTELPEPDLSLLRDIQRATGKKLGPIHLQHFHKDAKDLYYIGTHHGTDLENVSHETIAQAINKYKPQCVILEGIETNQGVSPSLGIDPKLPPQVQAARYLQSEENVHTAELLRKRNVPFVGGEPSVSTIFKSVEQRGYPPKEIMGLYLVRMIPIWRRRGVIKNREQFSEMATNFLMSPMFSHVPDSEKLTLDEFTAWYDQHKSTVGNKDYLQLVASDSNSIHEPDANYFQQMANAMDVARDTNIIGTINNALKQYDKVLVVYGNAHQYTSEPIFEKMFGSKGRIEHLILSESQQAQSVPPIISVTTPKSNKAYQLFTVVAGVVAVATGAIMLKATGIAQKSFAKAAAIGAIITGGITAAWSYVNWRSEEKTAQLPIAAQQVSNQLIAENTLANSGHVARLQQEQPLTSLQR